MGRQGEPGHLLGDLRIRYGLAVVSCSLPMVIAHRPKSFNRRGRGGLLRADEKLGWGEDCAKRIEVKDIPDMLSVWEEFSR